MSTAVVEDPRYQRLLVATREAARHGYDAVQMRDLAASAHLSLQTIYQFCSSKDHLIAEAHVEWISGFRDELRRRPPPGRTAADRVAGVLRTLAQSLDENAELTSTILRALYSPEPAVARSRVAVHETFTDLIDAAIGQDQVDDRVTAIDVLGHVVNSVLARWAIGSLDAAGAADELERASHFVIRTND